jgi:hypothetical protein
VIVATGIYGYREAVGEDINDLAFTDPDAIRKPAAILAMPVFSCGTDGIRGWECPCVSSLCWPFVA